MIDSNVNQNYLKFFKNLINNMAVKPDRCLAGKY
jgi:hypothetical protein